MNKRMHRKESERGKAALALRILGLLMGLTAIAVHLLINTVRTNGFMVKHNLAYFTLQTNLFSTLIFAVLVGKTLREHRKKGGWTVPHLPPSLHLACTLYITITMLGYWLLLAPLTGVPKDPVLLLDSVLLHGLSPLLAILDHLLFARHGSVARSEVWKWMLYPLGYLLSVVVIAELIREPYYTFPLGDRIIGLRYPYPFLDPQVVGTWGFLGVSAALAGIFFLLGRLAICVDRRLGRHF